MYTDTATLIAVIMMISSAGSAAAFCLFEGWDDVRTRLQKISSTSGWISLLFFVLAWLMNDSTGSAATRKYDNIVHWFSIFAVVWIIVAALSFVTRFFTGQKGVMAGKALGSSC